MFFSGCARLILAGALLLGGCSTLLPQSAAIRSHHPASIPPKVELASVPFFSENDNQCGPATLAMALAAAGAQVTPESIRDEVYLPGRSGSLQAEMAAAARRHGMLALVIDPTLRAMLTELAAGNPVVVLQNFGLGFFPLWHYALVVGYDLDSGEMTLRSGNEKRQILPMDLFEYLWMHGDYWAMVVVAPERIPASATEVEYARAASALEQTGRVAESLRAYRTLLARWPDSLAGWFGLGNAAYRQGNWKDAEQAYRQATELHPDSAYAFNNLAQLLAERGRLDEAQSAAQRAVALGGAPLAASRQTLASIVAMRNGAAATQ